MRILNRGRDTEVLAPRIPLTMTVFTSFSIYKISLGIFIASCLLFLSNPFGNYAFSQAKQTESHSSGINIKAQVGTYTLKVGGFITPNASLSLKTPSGKFLIDTSANQEGYFTFPLVYINDDFRGFCISAKDPAGIGASEVCLNEEAPTNNIEMLDLFLPPTISTPPSEVYRGITVNLKGYTMPHAQVRLHVNTDKTLFTNADSSGYYSFDIENASVGSYSIYAMAILDERESLKPFKAVEVIVLGAAFSRSNVWIFILIFLVLLLIALWLFFFKRRKRRS